MNLKRALRACPARLEEILAHFLKSFVPDNSEWLTLSRFREAVLFEIEPDQIIEGMLTALAAEPTGSARELFFYEAALALSYQTNSQDVCAGLRVRQQPGQSHRLRTLKVSSNIPQGHLERMERGTPRSTEKTNDLDRLRRDFARDAAGIASGEYLNGLLWAARVYLGIFPDLHHATPPADRFVSIWVASMPPWPWTVSSLRSAGETHRLCRT